VPRVEQEQPTGCTLVPHVESTLPQRVEEQPPTRTTYPLVDVEHSRHVFPLPAYEQQCTAGARQAEAVDEQRRPVSALEHRQPDSTSTASVAPRNLLSLVGWPDTEQYKLTSVTAPLLPVAHRSTSIGRALGVSPCMLEGRKCIIYGLLLGKPQHGFFKMVTRKRKDGAQVHATVSPLCAALQFLKRSTPRRLPRRSLRGPRRCCCRTTAVRPKGRAIARGVGSSSYPSSIR